MSRWPVLRDAHGNIRGYLQYLSFDIPALVRTALRRRPALLVAEPPPTTGAVVRLVAALQRTPYVYYAADIWSDGAASTGAPRLLVWALRRLEAWVLHGAALTLAVSEGVADRVVELGVDREHIIVVGNGVDTNVFTPEGQKAGPDGPYLAYTGTMSEWQGADVFIRALDQARRLRPDLRAVFLGHGSELPALRTLADERVPGAVDFPGVVPPEVAAAYIRGAVAGMVSIKPGLGYDFAKPTKTYAATACGTPVIFAGQGAGAQLVSVEGLGWAPGYDVDGIAEAMVEAVDSADDESRRQRLVIWTRDHASLSSTALSAATAALHSAGLTYAD